MLIVVTDHTFLGGVGGGASVAVARHSYDALSLSSAGKAGRRVYPKRIKRCGGERSGFLNEHCRVVLVVLLAIVSLISLGSELLRRCT